MRIDDRYYEQYLKIRVQPTFSEWCKHYGKVYASEEVIPIQLSINYTE